MLKRGLIVVTILVTIAITPRLLTGIENYSEDGIGGIVGGLLAPEDTVYSSGYTLNRWKRVRVGMSRSEVEAILGPAQLMYPIQNAQDGPDMAGRWSYSPGDTHFRCRVLMFRDGVVVRKYSEYYID